MGSGKQMSPLVALRKIALAVILSACAVVLAVAMPGRE